MKQERLFLHVLNNVVGVNTTNLVTCLVANGINSMHGIFTTKPEYFERFEYEDAGKTCKLKFGELNTINILCAWNNYLVFKHKKPVDWEDEENINETAYDMYRDLLYTNKLTDNNTTSTQGQVGNQTANFGPGMLQRGGHPGMVRNPINVDEDLARQFRKSIKLDKAHYIVLKNEKDFSNWKRFKISTAYSHTCENVLDQDYFPRTHQDRLFFNEQNSYMYDVFLTIIQISMGIHFVRSHEDTRNAQEVWKDYCNYMESSSQAELQISKLMTELTSNKLEHNYRGTTQEFILD